MLDKKLDIKSDILVWPLLYFSSYGDRWKNYILLNSYKFTFKSKILLSVIDSNFTEYFPCKKLEDMEFAKHIAVKAKKQLEADIEDLQKQLEEMSRLKLEVTDFSLL